MKVLVITNLFPNRFEPNRATFNFQHLSELSKITRLEIIVPISWVFKLRNIFINKKLINYTLNKSDVKVYYPSYFYIPKYFRCFQGILYFLSILIRSTRCISNGRPDVILGTWAYPDGFAAVLIGVIFKLPVVIKVHGTDIHSVDTQCKRTLTSWVLKRADRIVSVSENLADIMHQEFDAPRGKIVKVQNGVDIEKFFPITKDKALKILDMPKDGVRNIIFIGNLKPEKRPIDLLEAFCVVLKQTSQKVKLHFIGNGPLKDTLLKQVKFNNVSNDVVVHGAVSHKDIPNWLNVADLLVLPSLNEGMPNVILEALSCHTPVIASNVGGIPEVVDVGQTGYLFEPGNVNQLTDRIVEALDKQWCADSFRKGENDNTWEHAAKLLLDVLDNVRKQ